MYLLTCQYINISGVFQLSENKIKFEAKFTDIQFNNAKKLLEENNRAYFYKGWVYVVKARKNNNYEKSNLNVICCNNEIERVPIDVIEYFRKVSDTTIHTTIDSTHKPKPINNNPETIDDKPKDDVKQETLDNIRENILTGKLLEGK